jgi:hypothetical protein
MERALEKSGALFCSNQRALGYSVVHSNLTAWLIRRASSYWDVDRKVYQKGLLRNLLVRSEHTKGRQKMKELTSPIPEEVTR